MLFFSLSAAAVRCVLIYRYFKIQHMEPAVEDYYIIGQEMGQGNFSSVRVAINRDTKKRYALKIIDKSKLSPRNRLRIEQEVDILRQCTHPCVIRLVDTFNTNENFFLIMELMRGGDLFEQISKRKCYSEEEARKTIRRIVGAVQYLHRNGIVHRDLKPENIMLVSPEDPTNIKIVDFGFAKRISDEDQLTTPCGTPGYAAPEILHSHSYTKGVDMWSIGVIMYTMLVGFPPFYAEDDQHLMEMVSEGTFYFPNPHWKDISDQAKDLIGKLLERNTDIRYTASQALEHPWLRICQSTRNIRSYENLRSVSLNSINAKPIQLRQALNKAIDAKRDGCLMRSNTESSLLSRRRQKKANNDQNTPSGSTRKKSTPSALDEYPKMFS